MQFHHALLLTLGLGASLALQGCATTPPPATPSDATAPSTNGAADSAIDARADAYIEMAKSLEPSTTALLQGLATRFGGELFKLEYRLKTRKSLLRKIRKYLAENDALTPETVRIDDALRYTFIFPDEPAGNHNEAVHSSLKDLEANGHSVVKVKNYWPRGDGYSGINAVLKGPNGLEWELQFQTPESIDTNAKTRAMYEELRLVDTSMERKRELFDQMTAYWDDVPIPQGVLEPGSLHSTEEIKNRPRP